MRSSFNGKLTAISDAVDYILHNVTGHVLLIADNKATLAKSYDLSNHLGFPKSLHIAKVLDKWFSNNPLNAIEFQWFPGHAGICINELANQLAALPITGPAPFPATTSASCLQDHHATAVLEWHPPLKHFSHEKQFASSSKNV